MDYHAKRTIWDETQHQDTMTRSFLLEPICVFLGHNKLTSDKGGKLRFWAHRQQAKSCFYDAKILFKEFKLVDWESIHSALHSVPRIFKTWACKQVMRKAPAYGNRARETDLNPLCPSCAQVREACGHILE
jgi:hypothetical protein